MTDTTGALVDLLAARDAARDLHAGVVDAIDRARALCYATNWQATAATAFHTAVASFTGDLVDLRLLLADLDDEAGGAAMRLLYRLDHAVAGAGS